MAGLDRPTRITVVSALIVKVQVPVPVHGPLQPVNAESDVGVAISATSEPTGKLAVQVAPQSMPAGLERTPPVPVPPGTIVRVATGPGASIAASGPASTVRPSMAAASIVVSASSPQATTAASASARASLGRRTALEIARVAVKRRTAR